MNSFELHDSIDIELPNNTLIETGIVDLKDDGIVILLDEHACGLIETAGFYFEDTNHPDIELDYIVRLAHGLTEAEYQGRKVTLNKPMQGDVKKSKVYVKKPNGKVVKVNFGDKNMRIKKSNPERRKSFRARHNCDNPGPKWKARYWSCKAW